MINEIENARLHKITSTINACLTEDQTNNPTYVSDIVVSDNPSSLLPHTHYIAILEHSEAALLTIGELEPSYQRLA